MSIDFLLHVSYSYFLEYLFMNNGERSFIERLVRIGESGKLVTLPEPDYLRLRKRDEDEVMVSDEVYNSGNSIGLKFRLLMEVRKDAIPPLILMETSWRLPDALIYEQFFIGRGIPYKASVQLLRGEWLKSSSADSLEFVVDTKRLQRATILKTQQKRNTLLSLALGVVEASVGI
jgi:hypothetical protein